MFDGKTISYQQNVIRNDGFWPDIDAGDFERSRTIPAVTSHDTVLNALMCAVTEINAELESRKEAYLQQGYQSVDDIPGCQVVTTDNDGQQKRLSHVTVLYTRAVYARAKADLVPEAAGVGRRDAQSAQEAAETRRSLLTEAAMALRALTGRRRASVCLID